MEYNLSQAQVDVTLFNRIRELRVQFLRYAVVGGIAFVADAGLLFLLTGVAGMFYLVSAALSFVVGLMVNYLLSRYWVFQKRTLSNTALEFSVFAAIGVVGLLLTQLLMWSFTEKAHIHYLLSKCFAAGVVLIWSFAARKWALFGGME